MLSRGPGPTRVGNASFRALSGAAHEPPYSLPPADMEPEFWLRGPIEGIPPLLQPVAHALLQARADVERITAELSDDLLWQKPGGAASAAFHLQHLTGVVDRLFTYARNEGLSQEQFAALKEEKAGPEARLSVAQLVGRFHDQVESALAQLETTEESILTEARKVGRAGLPSNVLGLLFHAAEHAQRHVGQLLVTIRAVEAGCGEG